MNLSLSWSGLSSIKDEAPPVAEAQFSTNDTVREIVPFFLRYFQEMTMRKLIGTKEFYKKAIMIALPIIIQNGITAFVAMLDNIMVGQVGTDPMSGVAISNQLIFVFNIFIFGGISGAGIFGAQFYGKKDYEGVRHAFRFKLYMGAVICALAVAVFLLYADPLISLYLHEGGTVGDLEATKAYGISYLHIMLFGLIPFTVSQIYASTLRECGETVLPMKAGIVAVIVNTCLNYILIFGKFGMPRLGAEGAAIATVIARFTETAVIMIASHRQPEKLPYMQGIYQSPRIPGETVRQIMVKGMPLLINEMLWSTGVAIMNQCYAYRGLAVVAGLNITSTITNIFNIIYLAMGNVVAIMVGQLLGAGKKEEAIEKDRQLLVFAVGVTIVIGGVMACCSGIFPQIYKTEPEVKELASKFILISSLILPAQAFCHAAYFTIRAGGKTAITMIFDSVFTWVIVVPSVYLLSHYTDMPAVWLYLSIQGYEFVKCIIGAIILKRGAWAQNIVETLS